MSVIVDYGLDSPARALLILALSMPDKMQKEEMDILHIQKTIRYFEHLQEEQTIDFSNFKLGGVSYELEENLPTLVECGLVDKVGSKYVLTEDGKNAAKELLSKYTDEEIRKLKFAKLQLNDLTDKEMLFLMYMLIPSTRKHSVEFADLHKKRDIYVPRLFLKGRINSTTAAKWLALDEKEFLESLSPRD